MNQKLLKIFDDNQRITNLALYLLVTLIMVCVSISLGNLGSRFFPGWNGYYFPVYTWLVSVESIISWGKSSSKDTNEKMIYHSAEWVIIAIVLKALIYLSNSPDQLWVDLPRWQQNFLLFFEGEFSLVLLVLFFCWLFIRSMASDIQNLQSDLTDFHWEKGKLDNDRQYSRLRLAKKIFNAGLVLIITTLLTRSDLRQLFGETPASQASTANVLIFFLLALVFLSLTQFSMLRGRWFWNKTPIPAHVGLNWIRYSTIFLILVVLISFLLPTRFTYGLFEILQAITNLLVTIAIFLINIVIFPFILLFSLFGVKTETPLAPPKAIFPEILSQGDPAQPSVLWWEYTKSIFFWVIFLGIIGFAFWYYLRQNPLFLKSFQKYPVLKRLISVFRGLLNWLKGVNKEIARTISASISRLRTRANPSRVFQTSRWFDFRRLNPRQKILYYYLKMVENSAETGLKRKPFQTPAQFETDLQNKIPEAAAEVSGLTAQFNEARYSQHPVPEDRPGLVQVFWRKIIRALRSKGKTQGIKN